MITVLVALPRHRTGQLMHVPTIPSLTIPSLARPQGSRSLPATVIARAADVTRGTVITPRFPCVLPLSLRRAKTSPLSVTLSVTLSVALSVAHFALLPAFLFPCTAKAVAVALELLSSRWPLVYSVLGRLLQSLQTRFRCHVY